MLPLFSAITAEEPVTGTPSMLTAPPTVPAV